MTTAAAHGGDGDGGDPPSSNIGDTDHKVSLHNETFRVTGHMADLHTSFVGVDGRPSSDTASSNGFNNHSAVSLLSAHM